MPIKKFFRTRPGQRVDQPDFDHVADATPRSVTEQIGLHVLTGSADVQRSYVLEGFAVSVSSPTIVVAGGIAIVGYRDRGELRQGALATGGPAFRSINISTYPDGTYNVYVSLVVEDADFENRPFWDALASPSPVEVLRNTATRRTENWAIAVEPASPGDEWMRVAQVVKSAGTVGAPTDVREFFFEGHAATSPTSYLSEWGTGNDRNVNRALYGVKSVRTFARAVLGQLHAIIGGANGWWNAVPAGGSLNSLLTNKLARDGSQTMTGNLTPDGDSTRNLGAAGTRWLYSYATNFVGSTFFGGIFRQTAANNALLGPTDRHAIMDATLTGSSPNTDYRTIYQNGSSALATSSPTIEIAINAQWYYDVSVSAYRWRAVTTTHPAFIYSFGRTGYHIHTRSTTSSTWTDAGWTLVQVTTPSVALFATDIDATSGVLSAGTLTAGATTVASLLSSGGISGTTVTTSGNITASGNIAASGDLSGDTIALSTVAPATPALGTGYRDMLVFARGTVDLNNSPSYLSTNYNESANVNTITVNSTTIRVNFATPTATNGAYQVALTSSDADRILGVSAKTNNYFEIEIRDTAGATINPLFGTFRIDYLVIGGV